MITGLNSYTTNRHTTTESPGDEDLARVAAEMAGSQRPRPVRMDGVVVAIGGCCAHEVRRQRAVKAFLHVGMSKAGSSRIQRVLSANRDRLAAGRVLLPRGDDRHYFLVRISSGLTPEELASQGNHYYGNRSEKALARDVATFERQVGSGRFDTAVLSHEALFRQQEPALSTLRDYLARTFETTQVIIYLRDLASQRVSAINQAIKTGRISLDQALAKTHMAKYSFFLPRLEAVFGRQALHVVPFDRGVFAKGDIARHFADLCGLDIDIPEAASDRVNESLSAEAVMLADALVQGSAARTVGSMAAARRSFRPLLQRIEGTPFRVPAEIWQALVENARSEARWVRYHYGVEVPVKDEQPRPAPMWGEATIDSLADLILDLEAARA